MLGCGDKCDLEGWKEEDSIPCVYYITCDEDFDY